jgi:hypothetical protein
MRRFAGRENNLLPSRVRVDKSHGAVALAAATIHAVVQVMSSLCQAAMDEHPPLVTHSPFAKLDLPTI